MRTVTNWQFLFLTKVISGVGCLGAVGEEVKRNKLAKALVVTDAVILRLPAMDTLLQSLGCSGIDKVVYSDVEPNPTVENVENACKVLLEHNCDCVIGIGGGSVIDCAKGAALLATNLSPISKYEGADKAPVPALPIFAIPTTAGTGSEVSQSAVLTDGSTKRSIRSVSIAPKAAFLDPVTVSSIPFSVAVNAGLDAFAHNLESYISRNASPLTECLNEYAFRLIAENLRPYCANPANLEAAGNMQTAALLGAAAFANCRTALPHAFGMALGGLAHLPHGLACGITIPACIEFSWISNPQKFRRVAELMGIDTRKMVGQEMANALVKYVVDLIRSLDIKVGLDQYGVTEDQVDALAAEMLRPGLHSTDPRNINMEQAKALVRRALHYQ